MGCVAVRADGCGGVAAAHDQPAVDGVGVLRALRAVALAADVWNVEAPVRARSAARRVDVVGVVAVVAGCVGARLVLPVGTRVDRLHVAVDLVHHHAQAGELLGLAILLRGRPQVLVARHAAHLAARPSDAGSR